MPGVEGMDHVGITIPNLDEAVGFYSTLLGAKEIFRLGPFDAREFDKVDGKDWQKLMSMLSMVALRLQCWNTAMEVG